MVEVPVAEYEALANRFARSIESLDSEQLVSLCDPEGRFWNNVRQHSATRAEMIEVTKLEGKVIAQYVFKDLRITATSTGFVLQMLVTGSTKSGAAFEVATCLVARVTGNLISQVDEYVDSGQAGPIFAELLDVVAAQSQ